jgi:hypothetical protein
MQRKNDHYCVKKNQYTKNIFQIKKYFSFQKIRETKFFFFSTLCFKLHNSMKAKDKEEEYVKSFRILF